jgi:hypothetical protein
LLSQAAKRLCDTYIKLARHPHLKQRARWTHVEEPWPLQDSFGGIVIPERRDSEGNPVPFPRVLEYWSSWSKMLFIKDRLVAMFADEGPEVLEALMSLW